MLVNEVIFCPPPASLTVLTLIESAATTVSPDAPTVNVLPAGSMVLTFIVFPR